MKIGINASFLRKPQTGMGQVSLNFIKKLSRLETKDLEFVLYLEEDIKLNLPNNFQKHVFLPFWKRDDLVRKIWWEKYLLPEKVKGDGCEVFLSLYQCPTIISRKMKHLMIVHDIIPKLFPEYLNNFRKKRYQKLTEKAIRKANKIIAVSRRTEKDLIQLLKIDPQKIAVNYIDVDEIYKKEIAPEKNAEVLRRYKLSPGYILAGGGLEIRKNIEGVIRAYDKLIKRNENEHFVVKMPKLVIYGKLLPKLAPLVTDAEKLAQELNLTEHIQLLHSVPQKDMPAVHKNASIFVYPSHYEGFGLPVLEAMSQGTAVVTSKSSSLPEVGGDSVVYCDPDDIQDIAMVIKNLLVNKLLRDTIAQRGKERAKRFSWDEFSEKVLNIIRLI